MIVVERDKDFWIPGLEAEGMDLEYMAFANENLFEFDSVVDVDVGFHCDCDETAVAVHRNFCWDFGEWELISLAPPCAEAIRRVLHSLSISVGEVLVNSITPICVELSTRITRHFQ